MPDYGVEAIWRKPGRPGRSERVPRVPFICAVDHWTSRKWERADPAARELGGELVQTVFSMVRNLGMRPGDAPASPLAALGALLRARKRSLTAFQVPLLGAPFRAVMDLLAV